MCPLGGDLDRARACASGADDGVQLERRQRVIGATGGERFLEQVVQPDHRRVGEHHIAERGQGAGELAHRSRRLLEQQPSNGAQQAHQRGREPVIEGRRHKLGPRGLLVRSTETGDAALAPAAEAEHQRPRTGRGPAPYASRLVSPASSASRSSRRRGRSLVRIFRMPIDLVRAIAPPSPSLRQRQRIRSDGLCHVFRRSTPPSVAPPPERRLSEHG